MTVNVVPLDSDGHHAVQALLPWYVNNRLAPTDLATVQAHLADCATCRAELALERRMAGLLTHPEAASGDGAAEVERSLASLRARIALEGSAAAPAAAGQRLARGRSWRWPPAWTRWVLGLQFATIAWLATVLVLPSAPTPTYRALGASSRAAAGNVVVRFRPEATEREIRQSLQAAGARLVEGPTSTDAYLLSVPPGNPGPALAALRAHPAVLLAESLDAEPRP